MTKREIPPLHEIAKLELKVKFMYFIRDIGIQSAQEPAVVVWLEYMEAVASINQTTCS